MPARLRQRIHLGGLLAGVARPSPGHSPLSRTLLSTTSRRRSATGGRALSGSYSSLLIGPGGRFSLLGAIPTAGHRGRVAGGRVRSVWAIDIEHWEQPVVRHLPAVMEEACNYKTTGGLMPSERTGKKAASNAGKTLAAAKATKASKSASGSALAQTKSSGVTGAKAASNAGSTLGAKKSTKAAKSAAGSALTQKPAKKTGKR